jgi:hypothetical protein
LLDELLHSYLLNPHQRIVSLNEFQNRRRQPKGGPAGLTLFHNLLLAENAAYGFRRLSALRQPILRPLGVDFDLRGIGNGVVLANNFQETAIARTSLFDNNDPVIRTFFRPIRARRMVTKQFASLPLEKPGNYIRERSKTPTFPVCGASRVKAECQTMSAIVIYFHRPRQNGIFIPFIRLPKKLLFMVFIIF